MSFKDELLTALYASEDSGGVKGTVHYIASQCSLDPDDLRQEVALKILNPNFMRRNTKKTRRSRKQNKPKCLLRVIAKSVSIDLLRKSKRRLAQEKEYEIIQRQLRPKNLTPDEQVKLAELSAIIVNTEAKLSPHANLILNKFTGKKPRSQKNTRTERRHFRSGVKKIKHELLHELHKTFGEFNPDEICKAMLNLSRKIDGN